MRAAGHARRLWSAVLSAPRSRGDIPDPPPDDEDPATLCDGAHTSELPLWVSPLRLASARPADPELCPSCHAAASQARGVRSSSVPAVEMSAPVAGTNLARRPVAACDVAAGLALAVLVADGSPAAWPTPGPFWWPRPRVVPPSRATAVWEVQRCPSCRDVRATLLAVTPLRRGAEITVPSNPSPAGEACLWPLEASFDGGARTLEGVPSAGAGAALWAHPPDGGPPILLAETLVALPPSATAQIAEAVGCSAALHLLCRWGRGPRAARVSGDNLGVIRFCAGTSRFHRLPLHATLAPRLDDMAVRGWSLHWQAVRRRLNTAADSLATAALQWAFQLAGTGLRFPVSNTRWHFQSGGDPARS